MDLTSYVDSLRRELADAAELGGAEARALAERLSGPLESAARLALLDALSAATDEITRDLAPGSVELRLRGRDPSFVVTPPPDFGDPPVAPRSPPRSTPVATAVAAAPIDDDSSTARINFRLSEQLKARIEEAAGRDGISVNAWLVRAATAAVTGGPTAHPTNPTAARPPAANASPAGSADPGLPLFSNSSAYPTEEEGFAMPTFNTPEPDHAHHLDPRRGHPGHRDRPRPTPSSTCSPATSGTTSTSAPPSRPASTSPTGT